MARILIILSLVGALAVTAVWVALGAHPGWTKMKIETKQVDPVTEIEFTEYRSGFVPGIDFLGAGLAGCVLLAGTGWIVSKLHNKKPHA